MVFRNNVVHTVRLNNKQVRFDSGCLTFWFLIQLSVQLLRFNSLLTFLPMVNIGHPFEARMWSRKAGAWSRHISIFEHTQLRSMLHLLLRPSRAQLAGSKKKERTIVTILYDTAILLFRPCPRRNLLGNTKCHGTNIDLEQRSCFSRGTDSQRWWSPSSSPSTDFTCRAARTPAPWGPSRCSRFWVEFDVSHEPNPSHWAGQSIPESVA